MTNIVTTAVTAIMQANHQEINDIVDALKMRRTQLARQATRSFLKGDFVKFEGRQGPVEGQIESIGRKNLVVRETGPRNTGIKWRVTASMCEPVS
tara:strand:- start:1048 stop:1332 length:285 start_codon:yes stop_codon:yes gene_type:complete